MYYLFCVRKSGTPLQGAQRAVTLRDFSRTNPRWTRLWCHRPHKQRWGCGQNPPPHPSGGLGWNRQRRGAGGEPRALPRPQRGRGAAVGAGRAARRPGGSRQRLTSRRPPRPPPRRGGSEALPPSLWSNRSVDGAEAEAAGRAARRARQQGPAPTASPALRWGRGPPGPAA